MRKKLIEPPKNTTPDYYHNRAMEIKHEIKLADRLIKTLTVKKKYLQQDFDSNIAARDNGIKWQRKNKA